MAVNSVGDFIRSVFSGMVNKNGKIFRALLADGEGGGTIEKIFSELEDTRKAWATNRSLYDQNGEQLQKTLAVFSVLERHFNESDSSLIKRNNAIFYRNGGTTWGDKWDIENLFKTLWGHDRVYLVNNAESYEYNLLDNGNFEKCDIWTLAGGCAYERKACFEGAVGIKFSGMGTCQQRVDVKTCSTYFLHFFLNGKIKVQIKDNNNRFWNSESGEFGCWDKEEYSLEFEADDWGNRSIFFITDENVSSVQIVFLYDDKVAMLDYVRLNEKTGTSIFSLIAVFEGAASVDSETAIFAPDGQDEVPGVDYTKVSYHDKAFIPGAKGAAASLIYQEILEIVQPAGIVGALEILIRE